jgi:hypothetical protein
LLLIKYCKYLKQQYNLDIVNFNAYEIDQGLRKAGTIVSRLLPNYDLTQERIADAVPMILLDSDDRASLWVDLARYRTKVERTAVQWFGAKSKEFFVDREWQSTTDLKELGDKARVQFKDLKLSNFFTRSSCDIEVDYTRIAFDGGIREALRLACQQAKPWKINQIKDPGYKQDAQVLYRRYLLANYVVGTGDDVAMEQALYKFAKRRYSGELRVDKQERVSDEGEDINEYFDSLEVRLTKLEEIKGRGVSEAKLMESLEQFYHQSEIYRLFSQQA